MLELMGADHAIITARCSTVSRDHSRTPGCLPCNRMTHPWPLDEILRDYAIPPDEEAQLRAFFRSPLAPAASDASEQHAAPGTVTPEVSIDRSTPVCVPA